MVSGVNYGWSALGLPFVYSVPLRRRIDIHDTIIRLDALDFDQLIEHQEDGFRATLGELRKSLHALNTQIANIEDQLHPHVY